MSTTAATFQAGRLSVRTLSAADEALYCGLYTDARLMRHIGPPLGAEQVQRSFRAALAAVQRQPPRHLYLSLYHRDAGDALGVCALRDIDAAQRRAEIGLMLRRQAHASGIARESLQAVIDWSFRVLPVDRLYGRTDAANLAACRAARRAGFSAVPDAADGSAAAPRMFVFDRPPSRH